MQLHYCLGHLGFPKLKQLALIGKIPKKLATVKPPKCTGFLFGAMTKLLGAAKKPRLPTKYSLQPSQESAFQLTK